MQNSACFVGEMSLSDDKVSRIKDLVIFLVKKCRVQVFYFSSKNIFDNKIYSIISMLRKNNKTFSRVLILSSTAKNFPDIFKRYEDYKMVDSSTYIEVEKCKVSFSTYTVVMTDGLLNDTSQSLYDFAKENRKEIFVLN